MENEFTPVELFALALAAKTMSELFHHRKESDPATIAVMDVVAAKMAKYLEP